MNHIGFIPFISRVGYQAYVNDQYLVRVFNNIDNYNREIDLISRINSECVLKSINLDFISEIHIASPYKNEITLRQVLIEQGRLPASKVINLALQLLNFLHLCHKEEIIFRSLTPDNLLLDRNNKLAVTDFQNSFIIGEDSREVMPEFPRQGIEYVSPEYLDRYQLDFRNDIYQLGLLLFELLVGQLPWQYRSIARLLQEKSQPVMHLHKIDPNIPVQISTIISKMMEPIPKMRFSNVSQIIEHLEQAITLHYGVTI